MPKPIQASSAGARRDSAPRRICSPKCSGSKPALTCCMCLIAGTGPLLNAILAGEVQIIADPSTTSLPYIQAGKLRPIAIAGNDRDPKLPDVPTTVRGRLPQSHFAILAGGRGAGRDAA